MLFQDTTPTNPCENNLLCTIDIVIISLAGACLIAGGISFYRSRRRRAKHLHSSDVFSWLMIATFVSSFFFLFFKETEAAFGSQITETISLSGAFAGLVIVWTLALRYSRKAGIVDELEEKVRILTRRSQYVDVINKKSDGEPIKILFEPFRPQFKVLDADFQETSKIIAIKTGDIADVLGVDVWVNPENTDMQMARFGEKSISSMIRYRGAAKHPMTGRVIEDTIAKELMQLQEEKVSDGSDENLSIVAPAHVLMTNSGSLKETNEVEKIFHVACVHGQPGGGYKVIDRLADCVTNSLRQLDELNRKVDVPLTSILFPLMGTGTGGASLDAATGTLMNAAISYLQRFHKESKIDTVYFNAWGDKHLAIIQKILDESERIVEI